MSAILKQASTHKYHNIEDKKCFTSIVKKIIQLYRFDLKGTCSPTRSFKISTLKNLYARLTDIIEKHIFKIKNELPSSVIEILFARDSR